MLSARRGSILATSVSLTAVFLTLVLGGMAYVQSANNSLVADKFRVSAEQAARSGLDFVLAWGEASIDRETKLPRIWEEARDSDVFDPVALAYPKATNVKETLAEIPADPNTAVGYLLGSTVHEYVLGRQGGYITSFKSRIQRFSMGENAPRQYRVGVVGRVRKETKSNRTTTLETDERGSIVAERVLMTTIGREPVSKYAALIDIDVVKNWAPGEITEGPVHLNRGYVDEFPVRDDNKLIQIAGGSTYDDGTKSLTYGQMRNEMLLYDTTLPGNVGYVAVNGDTAPVFKKEVSMTEISGNSTPTTVMGDMGNATNLDLRITNYDYSASSGTNPGVNRDTRISINNKPWGAVDSGATSKASQIFKDPENGATGGRYGSTAIGPTLVPYPIQLPRSVRNRVLQVTGFSNGMTARSPRFDQLPDGIYLPTRQFWATSGAEVVGPALNNSTVNTRPPQNAYKNDALNPTTGGIYVRGNVEIMRMAADSTGNKSYYMFQMGPGMKSGDISAYVGMGIYRRVYLIEVDKQLQTISMRMYPSTLADDATFDQLHAKIPVTNITGATITSGATPLEDPLRFTVYGTALPGIANNETVASKNFVPKSFPRPTETTPVCMTVKGNFNGIIYVDCAQADPARRDYGQFALTCAPVTGNILSLGDPKKTSKRMITAGGYANKLEDGSSYEAVATHNGGGITGAGVSARRLTIMSRGNIFIQNHIGIQGLVEQNKVNLGIQDGNVTLAQNSDLLGLVADKQVVIGLNAPSNSDRKKTGVLVTAAIAALGDPALRFPELSVANVDKVKPRGYIGSFTTEGLMQTYAVDEDYKIACYPVDKDRWSANNAVPGIGRDPYDVSSGVTDVRATGPQNAYHTSDTLKYTYRRYRTTGGTAPNALGYPGNPIYQAMGDSLLPGDNPNRLSTRGKLVVFGSITQKKRGIVGLGNLSYDKGYRYDRRLQTLAPPIFPSSINILVRSQAPFSPDASGNDAGRTMYYRGVKSPPSSTTNPKEPLGFLYRAP